MVSLILSNLQHISNMDFETRPFEPGQQVQCKTRFNDVFKGEVMAFDLNSKILILKSPSSSGTSSNHDLHFLVLDSVSDVAILEDTHGECNNDLPSIEMKYIKAKQEAATKERMLIVQAFGNGVSQEGISLYAEILKKYNRPSDITWKDKVKIVVLNLVVISPPYKESDCEAISVKSKDALSYVKSIVRKFWNDYENKQDSQN